MKKFSDFLTEAAKSKAAEEAAKLKLTHIGYGKYADKMGRVTHVSKNGVLVKLSKGDQASASAEDPAAAPPGEQPVVDPNAEQQAQEGPPPPGEVSQGKVTITFGRFNPPTVGHEKLIKKVSTVAKGSDYRIYPSRSQDPKKNPLDPETKVHYMRLAYPDHASNIVNDDKYKSIFDVLTSLYDEGYADVAIVVGGDRVAEFDKLANKYNGKLYNFNNIEVISAGERDPDAEDDLAAMSASKLRAAAAANDYETFSKGMTKSMKDSAKKELFTLLRSEMQLESVEDFSEASFELYEIAPKLDYENLREAYYNKNLFKVGSIVENLNTGIVGKVVNRGVNYVIYVDERNNVYRGWLKDLVEVNDIHGFDFTPMGETGTPELTKKVFAMTPGQFLKKINKNSKSST